MTGLRLALLTVFGLGRLRPASGTWGSAAPVSLLLGFLWFGPALWQVNVLLVVIAVVFSLACVRFGRFAMSHFGTSDPRQVVADEVAGQCVALLMLPWRMPGDDFALAFNTALAATAFFAFRFFDIIKPPPVRNLERLPAGWGILMDDILAGLMALAVTQVAARLLWPGLM